MNLPSIVQNFLDQPIPPLLWHYTKADSLIAILRSQSFWLTDIFHQVDPLEFTHAHSFVVESWNEARLRITDAETQKLADDLVVGVNGDPQPLGNMQIFILSLTELGDNLSEWRHYGDRCKGGALGLDFTEIRAALPNDRFMLFAPCVYSNEQKKAFMRANADQLVSSLNTLAKDMRKPEFLDDVANQERWIANLYGSNVTENDIERALRRNIMRRIDQMMLPWIRSVYSLAAHFKQSGHEVDREWRLTFAIKADHPEALAIIGHFVRDEAEVPYLPVPFGFSQLLKQVKLGSRFNQNDALEKVLKESQLRPELTITETVGC